jgi:hypothetical protein
VATQRNDANRAALQRQCVVLTVTVSYCAAAAAYQCKLAAKGEMDTTFLGLGLQKNPQQLDRGQSESDPGG